jgi:hypothetical protein
MKYWFSFGKLLYNNVRISVIPCSGFNHAALERELKSEPIDFRTTLNIGYMVMRIKWKPGHQILTISSYQLIRLNCIASDVKIYNHQLTMKYRGMNTDMVCVIWSSIENINWLWCFTFIDTKESGLKYLTKQPQGFSGQGWVWPHYSSAHTNKGALPKCQLQVSNSSIYHTCFHLPVLLLPITCHHSLILTMMHKTGLSFLQPPSMTASQPISPHKNNL